MNLTRLRSIDFRTNTRQLLNSGYYNSIEHTLELGSKQSLVDQVKSSFSILAELKLASPLEGELLSAKEAKTQLLKLAMYSDALSIITEPNYFRGSLSYLIEASKFGLPILMKDFIIDKKQLDAALGASAILFIRKFLEKKELQDLLKYAKQKGLESILEVDNEKDFLEALDMKSDILALNNRNLTTFKVDTNFSLFILTEYKTDVPILSFSGYNFTEDILKIRQAGASGVLIGTRLSKSSEPDEFLKQLRRELVSYD